MSSYQKFTLKTFKGKLENGDYENATGANRAIGKTQELSDGDKAKAKAMVVTHFGVEPAKASSKKVTKSVKKTGKAKAPSKKAKVKPAKKATVKPAPAPKAAKKVAKRGKKKASKRKSVVAAPLVEPEPATAPSVAVRAKSLRAVAPRPAALAQAGAVADSSRLEKIQLMGQVITHVDVILRSMELSKKLFPKGEIELGVQAAQNIMTKAVTELEKAVVTEEKTDVSSTSNASAAKVATKKGKRAPKAVSAPVDGEEDEAAPVDPLTVGALDLDDPTLTEEERTSIRAARKVRPAIDKRFGTAADA